VEYRRRGSAGDHRGRRPAAAAHPAAARTHHGQAAGLPTLYTIQLNNGRGLQAYLEQIEPGHGVVHFTFFQGPEREAAITTAKAAAVTPAGADRRLTLIRLDKGRFAANLRVTPGRWTFRIDAITADGRTFRVLLPNHPAVTWCWRTSRALT